MIGLDLNCRRGESVLQDKNVFFDVRQRIEGLRNSGI